MPPGTLLLVRHAKAAGQAPAAPLTPAGQAAAQQLAGRLMALGVTRIVSSPWERAVDTAQPLADGLGLPVHTDPRLTERVLTGHPVSWWRGALRLRRIAVHFRNIREKEGCFSNSRQSVSVPAPSGRNNAVTCDSIVRKSYELPSPDPALSGRRVWSSGTGPDSGRPTGCPRPGRRERGRHPRQSPDPGAEPAFCGLGSPAQPGCLALGARHPAPAPGPRAATLRA
ncbi:hypothetical protein C8263_02560 [Deinococcus arcticus]|uniref:Histidine phosphatase family protein n=1 Tax=Deinococcus arcticus TaxID=2136176 RepID=A0A2T3WBZ2_9DEIO|nr:hypothetical protein C8263_02560 [Deinococcus arcticus]